MLRTGVGQHKRNLDDVTSPATLAEQNASTKVLARHVFFFGQRYNP